MNTQYRPKSQGIGCRKLLTCPTDLGLLLAVGLCLFVPSYGRAQTPTPSIERINDANGRAIFGELKREEGDILEILELKTLKMLKLQKSSLNDRRHNISELEVVANIGLSPFLVWKIRGVIPGSAASGKVARIDGATVYITLGASSRMEKGQELSVYRGTVEIRDPDDSTKVWIEWGSRVAKLVVSEVLNDNLSKARVSGDLDVELKIGDAVVPVSLSKPIAILPCVDLEGWVQAGGIKLSEDLTTGLTQGGISVVERTLLDKVLSELSVQDTKAFDAEKAQKIGKQLGAYGVLMGTLSPAVGGSKANLRLARVETGEILFATKQDGPELGPIVDRRYQRPNLLDAVVGRYDYREKGILTVTREGNRVFAQLSRQPKLEIFPQRGTTFSWRVVDAQVTFITDENGRVTGARHQQPGNNLVGRKLP